MKKSISLILLIILTMNCSKNNYQNTTRKLDIEVLETSEAGNKLTAIKPNDALTNSKKITLNPDETFQTITGFGGAFTEASANILYKLSPENRKKVLEAYFSKEGANYSLTRTHINSCDFSTKHYAYDMVDGDKELQHFSIQEDKDNHLIPMILEAQSISKDGFRIFASPWSAPPWMKDNKHWVGGKLLPEYNDTWALYFSKYIKAYKKEGIDIWGLTVENEPHGNGNNWESMLFSPKEMTDFVQYHLGPKLEKDGLGDVKILGYDQNRAGLKEWVDEMYRDEASSKYFAGTAIHWYESTYEVFPEALQYAHAKAPSKYLLQTEACVDSEIPHWKEDDWYWKKEATDWGWDWAAENEKYLHPKYSPVYRYARDIIGCLNNYVDGWVDWNMVLDKQGGPNWFKNWCIAPIIIDPENDEVYLTPIYYTMVHFSKYIRPGAKKIGVLSEDNTLQVTAIQNPDKSIVVVLLNEDKIAKNIEVTLKNTNYKIAVSPQAIQTIVLK